MAFGTGMRLSRSGRHDRTDLVTGRALDDYFQVVVDACEEAVLNSMLMAESTVGRDGHRSDSLHCEALLTLLEQR